MNIITTFNYLLHKFKQAPLLILIHVENNHPFLLKISVRVIYKYICTYTCIKRKTSFSLLTIHTIYKEKNALFIWRLLKPLNILFQYFIKNRNDIDVHYWNSENWSILTSTSMEQQAGMKEHKYLFCLLIFLKHLLFILLSNITASNNRIDNNFFYTIYPSILITNTCSFVFLG